MTSENLTANCSSRQGHLGIDCYGEADREDCLRLFDANCPEFFAPNERIEFQVFLDENEEGYFVVRKGELLVGAFGIIDEGVIARRRLKWILISPAYHSQGIGGVMMESARERAVRAGALYIDIAASHKSARFFERFGAVELSRTSDGWGPGMHRVDMEWRLPVSARRSTLY